MYSVEKNVLYLISFLKAKKIRYIIASPGTTNINFVKSIQSDDFFTIYSCVDERSAGYMACGLSAALNEPIVLTCTGATASRNYLPGITEAFYRKLKIISVTAAQPFNRIGMDIAQVIDRSIQPSDTYLFTSKLPVPITKENEYDLLIRLNKGFQKLEELGGPIHFDLETTYNEDFSIQSLPEIKIIETINYEDKFPDLHIQKISIVIGSHKSFSQDEIDQIDIFCEKYNAVVLCDHTSSYNGKYKILHSIVSSQRYYFDEKLIPNLTIYLGNISGDSSIHTYLGYQIWKVNTDGLIKDTYRKLTHVFKMKDDSFFRFYNSKVNNNNLSFFKLWKSTQTKITNMINDNLPYSNIFSAMKLHKLLPKNSTIHFGILNSLRSWNFFELDNSIKSFCNVGGFGIDGNLSTFIGSSFAYSKDTLNFLIIGDLAFFYDLNSLGNRHISNNLRILLINNGVGTEFKNFNHRAAKFKNSIVVDDLIAAKGHFGNKSPTLVRSFCESLGFTYISANSKEEFQGKINSFISTKINKPIIFELFTNDFDESKALESITSLIKSPKKYTKEVIKKLINKD